MEHKHGVYDSDTRFSINAVTRQIKSDPKQKTVLMQNDHNSERFTFELPRYIEQHDMSICNQVEVHYLNSDAKDKNGFRKGRYTVEDLQISPDDPEKVVCSWLISQNATQLVGKLSFRLRFKCVEDGVITYAWHTAINADISISDGINADETFEMDYVDIIEQWKEAVRIEFAQWHEETVAEMSDEITAWKEVESGKVRGEMTAFSAQWNDALNVERKRIDQFVALPNGSTAGDAELQDVRIGFDGTVHESAGTAVRSQMVGVNAKIDNIVKYAPEWINGAYISKGGNVIEYERYSASNPIPVRHGVVDRVTIITCASIDSTAYCFYDKYDQRIESANIGYNTTEIRAYELTVPEGAVSLRYSCFANNVDKSYVVLNLSPSALSGYLTTFENAIEKDLCVDVTSNALVGYYAMVDTGVIASTTNETVQCAEVSVRGGEAYEIRGYSVSGASLYALYRDDGTCILTFPTVAKEGYTFHEETVVIPEDCTKMIVGHYLNRSATTVKFSGFIGYTIDKLRNHKAEISKINRTIENNNMYRLAVGNILCIGDSLTAGAYYAGDFGGKSIKQNYPYYLGRICNCDVTNAGRSGYSASDWYKAFINTYDFAEYDSAVIWLGTNYGCSTMPTDEEISAFVPNTSVVASEADQALYLIKLINTIQAANPDCYIILCNVFASKSGTANNNAVVAEIAEKYNLQIVDMSDLTVANRPELHAGINNPHFGKAGNIYVANRIANAIDAHIASNPTIAEFGLTT